ncbi:MAG: FliM/FliN family flagellar motor C-terminal domain-containing protein [Planctomycetes bacterium]|nr:FliM/FliN family flagellar motor C-terminal domain-containing protein [Planctomycetota bacterium]
MKEIRRILGLSVPVSVVLAERYMSMEASLAIKVGSIIEFDAPFDSDLTLLVGNQPIGMGQAAKIGENFGLRVTSIGSVPDRIDALRGGSPRS